MRLYDDTGEERIEDAFPAGHFRGVSSSSRIFSCRCQSAFRERCGATVRRWANFPMAGALFWICLSLGVMAQAPISPSAPGGLNLFGDGTVAKLSANVAPSLPTTDTRKGLNQFVIFQDGRQLRGGLVSLGKEELVWRRPDVSEPLHFPRADVRCIVLRQTSPGGAGERPEGFARDRPICRWELALR